MKRFIEQIIDKKIPCYFISPSFGDAVSSTGELITHLAGKTDMTVINIFTGVSDGRLTFSARRFLKAAGEKHPATVYALRKQEDVNALAMLPISIHNLDIADAIWRKKKKLTLLQQLLGKLFPEFNMLYPTYPLHILSGKIAKEDKTVSTQIAEKLQAIVKEKNAIIFCPIGFGKHVDYLLIRNLCQELFQDRCIFYSLPIEDTEDEEKNKFLQKYRRTPVTFTQTSDVKVKILKAYTSQEEQFFHSNGLVFRPEQYYVCNDPKERKLTIQKNISLTKDIEKQWQHLWNSSEKKNFFNSPLWFLASLQAFPYDDYLILTCYDDKKLVGVLPLVRGTMYGIATYMSPGNQYHDNSSLLTKENDIEVMAQLIDAVAEMGAFWLSEVNRASAILATMHFPQLGFVESSKCPYLALQPDLYRFLSKKNKRILAKKFKDAKGSFSCKLFKEDALQQLETMLAIDAESTKVAQHKATFSDPTLKTLLERIQKLSKNTVAVAILYYKDEPVAYNYGFIVDTTYVSVGTAYKESLKHLAPGRIMVYLLLPELTKEGMTMLDFSRGYTRYKTDFAPYAYHQYTIFQSPNFLDMKRWQFLTSLKYFLEQRPELFEFARKSKAILFSVMRKQ